MKFNSILIGSQLYLLDNGNYLRVCDIVDDPEYEYGYDLFDGETKRLIDGGVFRFDHTVKDVDTVIRSALDWCDLDPDKTQYEFVTDDAEYDDLYELGFRGF